MRKRRLNKKAQERLIEHFVAETTARCAAELVGVNRKTAAYYFQRLRELIAYELEQESLEVFGGEIGVDESYRILDVHEKDKEDEGQRVKYRYLACCKM